MNQSTAELDKNSLKGQKQVTGSCPFKSNSWLGGILDTLGSDWDRVEEGTMKYDCQYYHTHFVQCVTWVLTTKPMGHPTLKTHKWVLIRTTKIHQVNSTKAPRYENDRKSHDRCWGFLVVGGLINPKMRSFSTRAVRMLLDEVWPLARTTWGPSAAESDFWKGSETRPLTSTAESCLPDYVCRPATTEAWGPGC